MHDHDTSLTRLRLAALLVASLAVACGDDAESSSAGDDTSGDGGTPTTTAGATTSPVATDDGGGAEGSDTTQGDASAGTTSSPTTTSDGGSDDGGPRIGPIDCRAQGDGISTITFVNGCDAPLQYRGSMIDGGELAPGEHACHDLGDAIAPIDAIRYWGFIGPDPGGEHHTLAELTLNTDFYDFDWYNISHVDAHNLPMAVAPVDMPECRLLSCPDSLLADCPPEGQYFIDGVLVACVSPDRDNPDSPVAQYFDQRCADAYAWSGDDADSVATCTGEDFDVIFCP